MNVLVQEYKATCCWKKVTVLDQLFFLRLKRYEVCKSLLSLRGTSCYLLPAESTSTHLSPRHTLQLSLITRRNSAFRSSFCILLAD